METLLLGEHSGEAVRVAPLVPVGGVASFPTRDERAVGDLVDHLGGRAGGGVCGDRLGSRAVRQGRQVVRGVPQPWGGHTGKGVAVPVPTGRSYREGISLNTSLQLPMVGKGAVEGGGLSTSASMAMAVGAAAPWDTLGGDGLVGH